MAKNSIKVSANVADTVRPKIAGAKEHPGWHALRTIAGRITTPLLPDDYLKLANPLWSARELRGRVLEVRRETVDSATLVIKPGWGFTFDYQPGQYVGIGLLVDGRWRWRSYSLTSSPVKAGTARAATSRSSRTITITVKAMPEGFLSTHLVGGVAPGTIVRLAAPQGNFVMPDPAPASVLFITGGSGITPVMSMLRTLVRRDQITDIVHLHSAPTESDLHVRRRAGRVAAQPARLPVAAADDPRARPPRLVPDRRRGAGLAGPADLGVRAGGHAERRRTGLVGRRASAIGCIWSASRHPARRCTDRAARLSSRAAGRSVTVDAATPLMEAGEGAGVQMPFGCRMGICQSCVVGLLDGHVRDLRIGRRTRTRKSGTDVHFRSVWRLRAGRLDFTHW